MRSFWWIVGLGALVWVGAHVRAATVDPLMTAFHATGATASGYSVNDWVEVHQDKSLSQLAQTAATSLHLNGTPIVTKTASYEKVSESETIQAVTTRVIAERLNMGTTFVVIDRTSSQGFAGLKATEALFQAALQQDGLVHADVNLEGVIPGRISKSRQQQLITAALSAIGASQVNGVRAPGYISDAGQSALINRSDSLQGHTVNIQVAASYNTYLHKTQVYVGSPLITVTY